MQFFPAVVELRKQIVEGAIGEVKYVHANFGFRLDTIPPHLTEPELGGGATLDIGIYPHRLCHHDLWREARECPCSRMASFNWRR